MTHLSEAEFVDLIEGTLLPARLAHVDACAACREQAAALHNVFANTVSIDVPEPSPLFWDHLQARVRSAVDAAPEPAGRWRWSGVRLAPFAVAAAVLATVYAGVSLRQWSGGNAPAPLMTVSVADPRVDGTPEAADAEVWDVLTSAASVALEDGTGTGMRAHPAAIDRAVQGLSNAELTELGRLLQSELKRSSN
jgi:hypothetical protein